MSEPEAIQQCPSCNGAEGKLHRVSEADINDLTEYLKEKYGRHTMHAATVVAFWIGMMARAAADAGKLSIADVTSLFIELTDLSTKVFIHSEDMVEAT